MAAFPDGEDYVWPTDPAQYELLECVGKGSFATVFHGRCIANGAEIAVKQVDLENMVNEFDDIRVEVRAMWNSSHANVLHYRAVFPVRPKGGVASLWFIMPMMQKGSCLRILRVLKTAGMGEGLKEEWIATILKAVLEGLQYFHKQGLVHRDIKAGNLLMDSEGVVKIADFGVSGWMGNGLALDRSKNRRTFVGTPCWMAPEVMEQSKGYDEKADIWSFGITALELAKGYAPYAKLAPMKVLLQTIQQPPPSLKSYPVAEGGGAVKYSRAFKEVVQSCLMRNPSQRPTCAKLLAMSFFKKARGADTLAKELLSSVPIPDVNETPPDDDVKVGTKIEVELDSAAARATATGTSWTFDDDEEEPRPKATAPGGGGDDGGFEEFEALYEKEVGMGNLKQES